MSQPSNNSNFPPSFPVSSESLEESLLPRRESEAEIIFSPPGRPVQLGRADLPVGGVPGEGDIEEQGMLMGPSHPIFQSQPPSQSQSRDQSTGSLPVPPGARFDPISPVGPGFYSPGEPDFDELLPPGVPSNPLGSSVRPPLKSKSGSPSFRAPFGHPHGAPPGPGNPPFFM